MRLVSAFMIAAGLSLTGVSFADTWVHGYYKRDGIYVPGHLRSFPNSSTLDNYSSQGNRNPFTGQSGGSALDYSSRSLNYGGGRSIHVGPRGGQFYYNDSGHKVYVPNR
jgi:hypothetical protein